MQGGRGRRRAKRDSGAEESREQAGAGRRHEAAAAAAHLEESHLYIPHAGPVQVDDVDELYQRLGLASDLVQLEIQHLLLVDQVGQQVVGVGAVHQEFLVDVA